MDLFLGVDAGSTVLKAAVFDAAGSAVAFASDRTPLVRSGGGRVEVDPEQAWAVACSVIRRVCASASGKGDIVCLGVAGAMVGAWVVDAEGQTLRAGINWEDSRAQPLIEELCEAHPGLMSCIFEVSGSVMQQGCTLPVVAALLRDEPDVMERARAVLGYKDWLRLRLTGHAVTDRSEAAVAPGDARMAGRSEALMHLFGLQDRMDLFPDVLESQAIAGQVTAAAAADTGLPEGLPVVTGAGDVIANVIGAGGLAPGMITGLLGTTCMIGVCCSEPVFEPADLGLLFSLPEGHWFRAMVNVAGTVNLDWAISLFYPELAGCDDVFEQLSALAASEPVGASGVTYLPYLSESGIIAPVADPTARAQLAGLTATANRRSCIRAVYEGVAFSVADLCDLLPVEQGAPILLAGGGARSTFWCDMIANVTQRSVVVPEGVEFGARGAALLAATAMGYFPSVAIASASVANVGRCHTPGFTDREAWAEARARYVKARNRLLGSGLLGSG